MDEACTPCSQSRHQDCDDTVQVGDNLLRCGCEIMGHKMKFEELKVTYPTREELEGKRDAILAAYPLLAEHADQGSLVGEEWTAWAELGEIEWLLR